MSYRQECVCCLSRENVPYLKGLRRCSVCSHTWADVNLSDDELRGLYSHNYFHGDEYADYEKELPALKKNFQRYVQKLTQHHTQGERLLEIGSAYGFFLDIAREKYQVCGIDISEYAVRYAIEKLGLDVRCGDYLGAPPPEKPYDIICMWDTIEHLREPDLYLQKAVREIRTGGTLALSTGDIGSFLARIRGSKWRLIHPPTHLHFFCDKSIRTLLERVGFANIQIYHPIFWRNMDSTICRIFKYPAGRWTDKIYETLSAVKIINFAFPINTWDLMTVYATRKS